MTICRAELGNTSFRSFAFAAGIQMMIETNTAAAPICCTRSNPSLAARRYAAGLEVSGLDAKMTAVQLTASTSMYASSTPPPRKLLYAKLLTFSERTCSIFKLHRRSHENLQNVRSDDTSFLQIVSRAQNTGIKPFFLQRADIRSYHGARYSHGDLDGIWLIQSMRVNHLADAPANGRKRRAASPK